MDISDILRQSLDILEEVRTYRRHIHSHPELSFEEHDTAEYISGVLYGLGIPYRRIAGTGVIAAIAGGGDPKEAVVLRADIDALPITENTGLPYASVNEGVMHACGHDMHAAALLGAATLLSRNRQYIKGTVLCLFQPAEERYPGGASSVLKERPFDGYEIKAFIGQHADPDLPAGTFGVRAGKYMASGDEVRITVKGKGGHGAMPHKLRDPVVAAAAVITALQQVVSRQCDPVTPAVLSIGRVIADGATNIIPNEVHMEGTFRTFDEQWRSKAKDNIRNIALSVSRAYGVEAQVDISDGYPCVVNSPELAESAVRLLGKIVGECNLLELEMRTTAEDFGYYTRLYPSLFYRFGTGRRSGDPAASGGLHTPAFNPDEDALAFATAGLTALALGVAG